MSDRIPILLDTDPGSDIDDVLALAYLLRQPRCDLVGITTVTGDVAKRAAIVEVVCRAYGREEIPIHLGVEETLGAGPGQPDVPHYEAIANRRHRMDRPRHTAIDFLRQTIRSRPGEIVLLSIGPFSNLATLFVLDPEIPRLLRGLVSMAGKFYEPGEEWNCRCDPAATAAVIKRSDEQTFVGLDVTMGCQMAPEEARRLFAAPPDKVLLDMAETWFGTTDRITFHDPLAAAVIFQPDLCEFERGWVSSGLEPGATSLRPDADGRHLVAKRVNADAFFAHYFQILGG